MQQQGAIAKGLYGMPVMGNDQQCGALLAELANPRKTLVLEVRVPYRQCLVDYQEFRAPRGRQAESEPHRHATGIDAQGFVEIRAYFGKILDFRQ